MLTPLPRSGPSCLPPPLQISKAVMSTGRPAIPQHLPGLEPPPAGLDAYIALMGHCWAQNPQDRPSFAEICRELK